MALVLLLALTLPALAAVDSPPLSEISPDPDYTEGSWSLMLRSSEFAIVYAGYSLGKASSTSVSATAITRTNETASSIGGKMYLQKWVGGAWSTVKYQEFGEYDTTESSRSVTWTVESGYYYRLRTTHSAMQNEISVSRTTLSDGIFVN